MSKVILVTGCSRGCGRALVEYFRKMGHTVLGCARSQSAVSKLNKLFGPPHDFQVVDVSHEPSVQKWAEHCFGKLQVPDLLINNAAIIHRPAKLWEIPCHEFDSVIDVNVKGTANVIRHFLPAMLKKKNGVIVNFSSGWGRSTSPEVSAYCATKWAIEGLTRALAQELPQGMCAVSLNPGIIHTEMLETCFGAQAKHYPSPEAWAEAAGPFLLKIDSRSNGKSLDVPPI